VQDAFLDRFRWIVKGVPDRDGNRVRLEAVRVGGKWLTTHAALRRFIEATTPRFEEANSVPRSASARLRASERAAAVLAEQGM
jgi:hypothetical protein